MNNKWEFKTLNAQENKIRKLLRRFYIKSNSSLNSIVILHQNLPK
jgi:hypothetical protein